MSRVIHFAVIFDNSVRSRQGDERSCRGLWWPLRVDCVIVFVGVPISWLFPSGPPKRLDNTAVIVQRSVNSFPNNSGSDVSPYCSTERKANLINLRVLGVTGSFGF